MQIWGSKSLITVCEYNKVDLDTIKSAKKKLERYYNALKLFAPFKQTLIRLTVTVLLLSPPAGSSY